MCTKCLLELGLEEDSHVVITGAYEAPAPPPTPEELQPLFPNHVIEEVLGQGGMGVVYRARQKGLDRPVALKVLPAKAGRDPAFAERFTREAKALASLNHPNITNVYDFGKAGEHHFLSMELVDGVNLRQLLKSQKVAPKQALQIVEQICDALQYAHDEGVVHRDIKPENILIDRKGRLKITDFGLAKLLGKDDGPTGLTMAHQVMGTPHYMAPEQVEHPLDVDHRADIYSLGVVFYELLTGELPLGRFSPPSGKVQIDVKLDEVVLRALEKEPAMRYQTASDVKTDVHGIAEPGTGAPGRSSGGRPAAASAHGGSEQRHEKRSGRGWLIAAGVGSLLILGMFGAGAFLFGVAGESSGKAQTQAGRELEQALADPPSALTELPLFDDAADQAALAPSIVDALNLTPAAVQASAEAMTKAGEEYSRLLVEHTEIERVGAGVTRVTLRPFPDELAGLVAGLEDDLAKALPPAASLLIRGRGAVRAELFELGDRRAEFLVTAAPSTADGATWSLEIDGRAAPDAQRDLSQRTRGYWNSLFRSLNTPLAASVLPAVRTFLDELSGSAGDGEEIRIQGFGAKAARRGRGADPAVELRLELLAVAADSVRANEMLADLLARLEALGATAELGSTMLDPEGRGIVAKNVEIGLPEPADAVVGLPTDAREDLSLGIRLVAKEAGVGDVDIGNSSRRQTRAFEDRTYDVSVDGLEFETLLELAQRLDELGPYSALSELRFWSSGTPASWRVRAELTARRLL